MKIKAVSICILFAILSICFLVPSYAQDIRGNQMKEKDGNQNRDASQIVTFVNSNPLITPETVSGFRLSSSNVLRVQGRPQGDLIDEVWVKDSDGGTSFIKLTLYPLRNQAQALTNAKVAFRATIENNQVKAIEKPTKGSYSGRSIGDFCWAYTIGLAPRVKPKSSCLIVIQGSYLFRLQVTNRTEVVDDSFTERLAHVIIQRLRNWSRPDGSIQGDKDDDDHDGRDKDSKKDK